MAILEKEALVGLGGGNANYFENKGYEIPKRKGKNGKLQVPRGTEITVKVSDLSQNSGVLLTKICDICGKHIVNQPYCTIYSGRLKSKDGLDRCQSCSAFNNGKRNSIAKDGECIAIKDQEFAKLFWDKEDTYKYSCHSGMNSNFKCPNCGSKIKNRRITDVYDRGLNCPKCSDGISYPEKFIYNVFEQQDISFECQKVFEWSKLKRYDFYLQNFNWIIEVHGGQHYGESSFNNIGGRTLQEEQENDRLKEKLAKENGISKYIIIDARLSTAEHIKDSLLKSKLSRILNMEIINWKKCDEYATSSLVNKVCEIWNSGITNKQDIANITGLHQSTVYKYLNKGARMGKCDYDGENKTEIVQISLNMEYIQEFDSISDAHKNTGIDGSSISKVCRRKQKKTGGYHWMYKNDYYKYKTNIKFRDDFNKFIKINKNSIQVINVDTNEVFNSITEASEFNDISVSSILYVCRGKKGYKTAGRYKWMFKEDYDRHIKENNKELIHN